MDAHKTKWIELTFPNDLGDGHRWNWLQSGDNGDVIYYHPCSKRPMGIKWIGLMPGDQHSLVSGKPLHIEPDLICEFCGDHGFIRDGKWIRI